jgi:peptide deformylase
MGDARLWQQARAVERFATAELEALIVDMEDTMRELDGAGLAAPQIGVDLRVVIFGIDANPRYPRCRTGAAHGLDQPGPDAAFR